MKRLLASILIAVLILGIQPAYAAGKLSETQENFWVVNGYSTYAYAYAKIENIGDKPIKVHAGILEVFDDNGDTITSTDYLHAYPAYLQPDEYSYAYMYTEIEDNDPPYVVDDYLVTITGKSDMDYYSQRLFCEPDYQEDVSSGYSSYDYMYATVTNDTDETIYNIYVIFALLDKDDNILYMDYSTISSNQGLMPGSSMVFRETVNEAHKETFSAAGYEAVRVDAIAYANIKID